MGISLCTATIDTAAPENPTKTDKAERQIVFVTVWRSVGLYQYVHLSADLT